MSDDFEDALVRVRADTRGFAADVEAMRSALEGPLGDGAERAGRAIESALTRAMRTGRLGFEDLQRVAASAMAEIARSAISSGLGAVFGGSAKGGGGLVTLAGNLLGAALGLPGRATGGPVTGGRGYLVGERGPELFVPASAGRVEPLGGGSAGRDISITVNIAGGGAGDPQRLAMSDRRVAQAVRRAVEMAEN